MKILESQSAVLTNFEVYQHLLNQEYEFKQPDRKRKVPRSVQNIVKEVNISLENNILGIIAFVTSSFTDISSATGVLPHSPKPLCSEPNHI